MPKKKYSSGNILQIPLPANLGFAYAKCVNLLESSEHPRYPILIRVYNLRSTDGNVDLAEILERDLVLCPLLIAGIVKAFSQEGWKVVGNDPLSLEEMVVPEYKCYEPISLPLLMDDFMDQRTWYFVQDADISKKYVAEYESVRHLENLGAFGCALISTKIAMALIQAEGKKIEDYFSLTEHYERSFFFQTTSIRPYYTQPPSMRGRALRT